ncbi:hypothetical protein [Quatrionicoccus australiensis]|uniref:hypothetical protein n=1 Tax=Quatrionicoccus australiensis TaxID=138118 RepID=UPI001CFBC1B8|nr:hypothetical protein [Quatrionicoccus australiensis]MCB4359294.1 hypothetical protein [Quatrionicoccus australiensis]
MREISILGWIVILVGVFGLSACSTGGEKVEFHTFEFDAYRDSPDIEVLDYQYGEPQSIGFAPERERVRLGQALKSDNVTGYIPRGDKLHVKWRIKATGEVLEDTVDLRHRLPESLDHLTIHFACYGRQLYVFIEWPWDGQPWTKGTPNERFKPIQGGTKRFDGSKIQQIYPDPAQK